MKWVSILLWLNISPQKRDIATHIALIEMGPSKWRGWTWYIGMSCVWRVRVCVRACMFMWIGTGLLKKWTNPNINENIRKPLFHHHLYCAYFQKHLPHLRGEFGPPNHASTKSQEPAEGQNPKFGPREAVLSLQGLPRNAHWRGCPSVKSSVISIQNKFPTKKRDAKCFEGW